MEAIEAVGTGVGKRSSTMQIVLAVLGGIAGMLVAVAAGGKGTYDVTPFRVQLSLSPGAAETTLGVKAAGLDKAGTATAATHSSPLSIGATIVGVDAGGLAQAVLAAAGGKNEPVNPADPEDVARYLSANGKSAARAFGIKVAALGAAGAFALAMLVSMGKIKRALIGTVAGVAVLAVAGLLAYQTYDATAFRGSTFGTEQSSP